MSSSSYEDTYLVDTGGGQNKTRTPRPNLYDYLKILALIAMVIDHIGFFLFPDQIIWRLVGRISFPIFLFLVGYNGSFGYKKDLRYTAIIIQFFIRTIYFLGYSDMYFLNILVMIALVRLILQQIIFSKGLLLLCYIVGLICVWFTYGFADFGSISLSFAIMGYWTATQKISLYIQGMLILTVVYYMVFMVAMPMMQTVPLWYFIGLGILLLSIYTLLGYKNFSLKISPMRDAIVSYISKHALLLYVVHASILLAIYLGLQVL